MTTRVLRSALPPIGAKEEVSEADTCVYLSRIVSAYASAEHAGEMGNMFDSYVHYQRCYEMLNAFMWLSPTRAMAIPPAKCMTTCPTKDSTCNINYFRDIVKAKMDNLHGIMVPAVEKLMLNINETDKSESDETFACQSIKLPQGQDKLCDTWFNDIIGLQSAKERLQEGFIFPLLYPNLYGAVSGGVLLYGPPGTGKTMLARALINETEDRSRNPKHPADRCSRFLYFAPTTDMLSASILSYVTTLNFIHYISEGKYVGETEKKITDLFMGASKLACAVSREKKMNTISVIFIDEVDGLAPSRDGEGSQAQIVASAVNTLLQMMDGVNSPKNVVILAATNYPESLDSAFRRRFQYQIPVDLPTQADIEEQLNALISKHVAKYEDYAAKEKKLAASCDPTGKSAGNAVSCAKKAVDSEGCNRPEPVSAYAWKDKSKGYAKFIANTLPEVFKLV